MAEALDGGGVGIVSLHDVAARAGVSSAACHEAFPDRDACLLAAFDLAADRACTRMLAGYHSQPRWLDAIKAGLAAFLAFLEDEPALGRLLVVYSMSGGEQVLRRRVEIVRELAAVVDRGRLEGAAQRQQPPAVIAEGVVGAVLAVLQNRLLSGASSAASSLEEVAEREGERAEVMDLFGSLVSIIVLPYLGAGVARRELTRPAPRISRDVESSGAARTGASSIEHGGARLTYRTARVLRAIGDYPGASNREVADRAGIVDQGQISKLLGRLQARGLISKIDAGRTRGAPNSWQLTERGELVLKGVAIRS
jgi:AcrR family transcriptional regulator